MPEVVELFANAEIVREDPRERFALDVLMGLSSKPKSVPPKYFYDSRGSRLFEEITRLEEYYPTRCEREIFRERSAEIATSLARGTDAVNVIELGAGDGHKSRILLSELVGKGGSIHYMPVDISRSALEGLMGSMASELPDVACTALAGDYYMGLSWVRHRVQGRKAILFLGSNIGNFSGPQARMFLRTLWNSLNHDDCVLVGFDMKKSVDVLLDAYNDSRGVTRDFNLNLLERMNRELEARFDLSRFEHFGTYNVQMGAMESFLLSLEHQEVFIGALNKSFHFAPFEAIHTEFSFKFLPEEIEALARETGFVPEKLYYDSRRYFCDAVFRVVKATA